MTSSVDNKQAKSNGNIDKKNQQFIENQNNWIGMPSIIAWNKVFIIWNRSDAIYAKCNKKKYAYYQRMMKQLLHFEPTAHDWRKMK